MTYVLIVEDDLESRRLAEKILRHGGFRILAVPNVFDAIEAVAAEIPAVIALDISMPGMDGWEFYRYLRANERTAKVPVVFVTANAFAADRDRALAEGAAAYITKPYRPQDLLEAIRRYAAGVPGG